MVSSDEEDDSSDFEEDAPSRNPEAIVNYVRKMSQKLQKDAAVAVATANRKQIEGEKVHSARTTPPDYEKGMKAMIFNETEKRWLFGEIVTTDGKDVSVNVYKETLV